MHWRLNPWILSNHIGAYPMDKPQYNCLAFKNSWNPNKILISPSLRVRVKCGVLGGKEGEVNLFALDRHTYQALSSY